MSEFFDRIKKLFSLAADESNPATHEVIVRTEAELEVYRQWKRSKRLPRILESFQARIEGRFSTEAELSLYFIDTTKSRGFVLQHEEGVLTGTEMRHLLDYFQEQILAVGYVSYMSDVKNQLKGNVVETIERHYLKPKLNIDEATGKMYQRFGNISIEYLEQNHVPVQLKLQSNIYNDRKYSDPRPFQELMELLAYK